MNTVQNQQNVDLSATGKALDRSVLEGIGSCHAYLTLREDWREHARLIQREIGFHSVRCHGIFHDLVGIYQAWPVQRYNFQNLDKIYDFWLSQGLKPYVELSFMPQALASGTQSCFAYHANVTPPKDMAAWNGMISAFVSHLIERYGSSEVRSWNFEVWNEPDLGYFFSGDQTAYFELYANTARTIKAIDPQIKVGGPATSRNMWVQDMLAYCEHTGAPVDFISTHHYCADSALIMGEFTPDIHWRGQKAMQVDVARTAAAVKASKLPNLEVHYTEWNVSPAHADSFGKDSEFTAAFVLQTAKDIAGLANRYMLWAISDVFEESGPGEAPFSGKYGLVNLHGIKKPVFHALRFFSRLYDESLSAGESGYVTRSARGDLRVLSWNFNEPQEIDLTGGEYRLGEHEKDETLCLAPLHGRVRVRGWQVNRAAGNAYRAWQEIGCPEYLLPEQVESLKRRAEPLLFRDEVVDCAGELAVRHTLPPSGVVYYEIERL